MAFKVIQVDLTDEQIAQIEKAVKDGDEFALLAEPRLSKGMLNVRICTNEQFEILRPAILEAYKLPEWRKKQ